MIQDYLNMLLKMPCCIPYEQLISNVDGSEGGSTQLT